MLWIHAIGTGSNATPFDYLTEKKKKRNICTNIVDRKIVYNHIHDAHRKLKKAELSAFICVGYFEFPAAFLSEKSQLNKIKTI